MPKGKPFRVAVADYVSGTSRIIEFQSGTTEYRRAKALTAAGEYDELARYVTKGENPAGKDISHHEVDVFVDFQG